MENTRWIPIEGNASVKDGIIKYDPQMTKAEALKRSPAHPHWLSNARVASNVSFESGEISFQVKFSEIDSGGCFIHLNNNTDASPLNIGFQNFGNAYGISKQINGRWEFLRLVGESNSLQTNYFYDVKIKVNGSDIKFFVDGVEIANLNELVKDSQIHLHFHGYSTIEVKDLVVTKSRPKAFVVMEFKEEYDQLYTGVIKPVTEGFGYDCKRADDYHTTNLILKDIEDSIKASSVIIADITPNNPNVFYEVGYSHAIGKPTILLCDKKRDKLPFDLSGFRTLFYDNTIAGKSQIEQQLKNFLEVVA